GKRDRSFRCSPLSVAPGIGRETATQSTSPALTPASSRHIAMAASGSSPLGVRARASLDSSTAAASRPSIRIALAASLRMPPIPRMIMLGSDCQALSLFVRGLLRLFDLSPGIAQRHGPVEHEVLRRRVPIDTEITQPLELVAVSVGGS